MLRLEFLRQFLDKGVVGGLLFRGLAVGVASKEPGNHAKPGKGPADFPKPSYASSEGRGYPEGCGFVYAQLRSEGGEDRLAAVAAIYEFLSGLFFFFHQFSF